MAARVSVNLRSVLARFLQAEPLHNPHNSFELKETVAFCESELRYLGTGTQRLPPWSLPFVVLPVHNTWRGHRTAEAVAGLVVAIIDLHCGIRPYVFERDEVNLFEILWASVEAAGYLDEWRVMNDRIAIAIGEGSKGGRVSASSIWQSDAMRQRLGLCDNRNKAA